MNKTQKIFSYILLTFFSIFNIGNNIILAVNQERDLLLEQISNSKITILKSINGDKYINTIDKISLGVENFNDINKIKKINSKIDEYIEGFSNNNNLKSKKLTNILLYLKYNVDLITYDLELQLDKELIKLIDQVGAPEDDFKSSAANEITGTTYYFSSSTGNDNNDGLTPETAKKTWYKAKILFNTMNAGDGILLKRGDTWSANDVKERSMYPLRYVVSGEKGKPKVLSSYGIGPRPVIDGIIDKSTVEWTYIGKINNLDIWETMPENSNINIGNIVIDGKIVLGTRELDDFYSDLKWNYSHDYENTGKLYTHVDPSKHKFEWSDTSNIITYATNSSYINIKHIEVKNARKYAFTSAGNFKGSEIEYNTMGEGSAFGIVSAGAGAKYRYNIVDSKQPLFDYTDGNSTYPCGGFEGLRIWAGDWGNDNPEGTEIAYNTVTNFGHANVAINGSGDGTPFTGVDYHHNLLTSPSLFYGGKTSIQFNVEGIKYHHNFTIGGDRNQLSGHNGVYYNNIMVDKMNSPFARKPYNNGEGFVINDYNGFTGNIIKDNIFYNTPGAGIAISGSNKGEIKNNIIKDNIFYNTGLDDLVYPGGHKDVAIFVRDDPSRTYNTVDNIVEYNTVYNTKNNSKTIFIGREREREDKSFLYSPDEDIPVNRGNIFRSNIFKKPDFISVEDYDFRPTSIYSKIQN